MTWPDVRAKRPGETDQHYLNYLREAQEVVHGKIRKRIYVSDTEPQARNRKARKMESVLWCRPGGHAFSSMDPDRETIVRKGKGEYDDDDVREICGYHLEVNPSAVGSFTGMAVPEETAKAAPDTVMALEAWNDGFRTGAAAKPADATAGSAPTAPAVTGDPPTGMHGQI
jgi:hypothetical protein